MKIAKDTVVSLNYELFDSTGELLEKVEEHISYLHGGYDGIFPLVEEALHGKDVGEKISVTMHSANMTTTWSKSSRAALSPRKSPSVCNSRAHPRLRTKTISCSLLWLN
jgi:FKBP-type peptidyl-prolyl cis-trans isomerase SlyD